MLVFEIEERAGRSRRAKITETATFQSQTAIVTGSCGLGRGILEVLAARKMRVVAVARGAARLEAAAKEMRVEHLAADVPNELTASRLMQDVRGARWCRLPEMTHSSRRANNGKAGNRGDRW
jgi:NAD(P)-dependent dehydrogenase (short-subunit alcohol dehydrogenase family)